MFEIWALKASPNMRGLLDAGVGSNKNTFFGHRKWAATHCLGHKVNLWGH
jgi:hypothetical protein